MAILCPNVQSNARAEGNDTSSTGPVSIASDTLALSISQGTLVMAADPTINNGIVMGSVNISAQTSNATGYTLKISTPDNTAMQSTDEQNTSVIPTLASATTLANFANLADSRWGYYFGDSVATANSTFSPFADTATDLDSTNSSNTTPHTKTLTIAARVGMNLPASEYNGNMIVSAMANPPALGQIRYMQDMTSDICSFTPEGYETQLEDSRDGTLYWVRKQADGRCWMVQNLALDLSNEKTLTPDDTNITSDWTPPSGITNTTSLYGASDTSGTLQKVWNLGKNYVLTKPLDVEAGGLGCGVSASGTSGSYTYKYPTSFTASKGSAPSDDTSKYGRACTSYYTNVSSKTADYIAEITSTSSYSISENGKGNSYDAHYLVGNFYTWKAATANTGTVSQKTWDETTPYYYAGSTSASICPKGWKLPSQLSGYTGEVPGLFEAYGYTHNGFLVVPGATSPKYSQAPFYIPRAGGLVNGGLDNGGYNFRMWAAAKTYSTSYESIWLSYAGAANYPPASRGLSVRCINDDSI